MPDEEAPQPEAQPETPLQAVEQGGEEALRSTDLALDAAVLLAPAIGVAAEIGKGIWDPHQEQKPDAPEIILPPGTEKD